MLARESTSALGASGRKCLADRAVLHVVAGEELVELGARAEHLAADERAPRAFRDRLDARQRSDLVDHVMEGVVGLHPLDGQARFGDLARADQVRYLPKWAWAVVCLISCPLGGLIYIVIGRNAFGRVL